MKNRDQCCSHDCSQGRAGPRRAERRTQASLLRRLFGWIISERRKTLDPRARVDMGGLPGLNRTSSEQEAQSISTPEFHRLLQQVCEVETILAAAGTTPAIYEAFERASNARKALISYIDAQRTTTSEASNG